ATSVPSAIVIVWDCHLLRRGSRSSLPDSKRSSPTNVYKVTCKQGGRRSQSGSNLSIATLLTRGHDDPLQPTPPPAGGSPGRVPHEFAGSGRRVPCLVDREPRPCAACRPVRLKSDRKGWKNWPGFSHFHHSFRTLLSALPPCSLSLRPSSRSTSARSAGLSQ